MLSLDDYQPITLEDKPIFDKHYEKSPPTISDNLFTTLISWKEYANFCYTILDKNLLIMSEIENKIYLRPPSGKINKNVFDQVIKLAKKQETAYSLSLIDKQTKGWMESNYKGIELIPRRDYFDYVYLSKDLAELVGSEYSKIRNRLNKFKRNFSYTVEEINKENMSEVREFLKRWCLWRDCESDPILENEKKAILYSARHFFDLGLSGIAMKVHDNIEAISVYEKMNSDTVVVHYEKGSPDYDGIYKAINQEVAKIVQKNFKYINRESDMGVPGLRKAKMSYRPHHIVEVFALNKDSI